MVADCYVGLVSNRQHRRALMPYYAIEKMLKTMPRGLYDAKVLRGLLHAMSLFPIGSCIELTDGRIARVVRSTGETYTQPIVELWDTKHRRYEPDLLNLKTEKQLKIRRAIPEPIAA
jgi:HD-GYP domain-containing protein (c-di-GMP phosphodiesterase class II)